MTVAEYLVKKKVIGCSFRLLPKKSAYSESKKPLC